MVSRQATAGHDISPDGKANQFYDEQYLGKRYAAAMEADEHFAHDLVAGFVRRFELREKRCLEVGCGRGAFQDVVEDYTGLDLSRSVRSYFHKPFVQGTATKLPFDDDEFDGLWSIAVLEHVSTPELALQEMRRVLKPGGVLLLHAAWHCRSWAANGYPVRPYSDFGFLGKVVKASIRPRNSIWLRGAYVFPRRLFRYMAYVLRPGPTRLRYTKLTPNYDQFWMPDSDAVSSLDPFEALLWFASRDDACPSHPRWWQRLLVRHGALLFQVKPKKTSSSCCAH